MSKKKCVFAGTFDPPTLGHKSVVEESLKIFDEVVIALLCNPQKSPRFSQREREEMLALEYEGMSRVKIISFTGTVDELMKKEDARFYVRGIRNSVDLDYENANFYASKKLDKEITAIYLPCPQHLLHVSSSMVRNSLEFGTPIDEYVSEKIKQYIERK